MFDPSSKKKYKIKFVFQQVESIYLIKSYS